MTKKSIKDSYYSSVYTDEQIDFIIDQRLKGSTFPEIVDKFKKKYKITKTSNSINKTFERYKDYDFSQSELVENMRTAFSAKKSKAKIAKENRALLEYIESNDRFLKEFQEILKKNPVKVYKPIKPKKVKTKRTVVAHLSDLHIGANIDDGETGGINKFGFLEASRRIAYFIQEVVNYKKHHRNESDLIIALNGDLGAGIIHDQESYPPMTTQFAAIVHMLSQGISYAANFYNNVKVVCTTGNHLRSMHKSNKGRQFKQKYDGFHTKSHIALKYALNQHKNIEFIIPESPFALVDIQGHKYMFTHGDTVINPGNVGKTVSTESLKNKINDLISGLGQIDVVVCGHVHVGLLTLLNNGTYLITNGCLSGVDEFAVGIGITKNMPMQQIFEVIPNHQVGDMRFVRLHDADKDQTLDKIIKPFVGKF